MVMGDVIITGASRGIGRALALALAPGGQRLVVSARDEARLDTLVTEVRTAGGEAIAVAGDLGSLAGASGLAERISEIGTVNATLVHNAGLWPSKRVLDEDGFEHAFVVNHLAPLALQRELLARGCVSRIMVVSAGLIVKGRFDATRTPQGEDFSSFRTYCTTKLCFAAAMRGVAAEHPELDVLVLHPGVVRTDLGARGGPLGWLLSLVKRRWEAPEKCGARLARLLGQPRWSSPGEAAWYFEEQPAPWPATVTSDLVARVTERSARLLAERPAR